MDIVLGAMAFVLNKKHLETAPGTDERDNSGKVAEGLLDNSIPSLEVPPCRIQRAEVHIKETSPACTT